MDNYVELLNMKKQKKHRISVNSLHDDDFDDTPLFTRVSSIRVLRTLQDSPTRSEVEIAQEEQNNSIPFLNANLFATVLEDTVAQLRILAECNNELRIKKALSDMESLYHHKYGVAETAIKDELEGVTHQNIHSDKYKLDKLANDRQFCTDTILAAYVEMSLKKSFETLTNINQARQQRDEYVVALTEEETKNKTLRRELSKQLRQQRNHHKSAMYETNVDVENLRSNLEDALLVANIRERYVDNWQVARAEQNTQTIIDKEAGASTNISEYRKQLDRESRVHTEVELLMTICITETLHQVEEWMDKYDTDIERMDLTIQIKKNDYKTQVDKRIELEKRLEEHDQLMKNWVKFKDDREAQRQYHKKMTEAANVVQAWWRGLLTRLMLGPYKPKKRPPVIKKK